MRQNRRRRPPRGGPMTSRLLGFLGIGLGSLVLTACSSVRTTQSGAVGVDWQQTMFVSSAQVNQVAAQEYSKTISEVQKKGTLDRDPAEVQRVRAIAGRLISQTGAFRP